MKAAFVFSGQGAQKVGMGKDLFETCPAATSVFEEADRVLGWSVSELCFEGPSERLTETRYCQPAIYTMSIAALAAFKAKYGDMTPVGCGGLSLGEYAALHAAGVFDFAEGLKLVARRGELMDDACKSTDGAMASVLKGEPEPIREICAACDVDVANYNCPGQIVISGGKDQVKNAVAQLKEKGFRVIPLKVAGAYHSRLMKEAGANLQTVLDDIELKKPSVPVAQNVVGGLVEDVTAIRSNLVEQVAGSVRWEECVRKLIEQGADTFIEFGPGNVLTGLVKRTTKEVATINIGTVEELEAYSS